jgi:uncharacterized protein
VPWRPAQYRVRLDSCSDTAENRDLSPPAGIPDLGRLSRTANREGKIVAEHPNVTRINEGYAAFAKGDFAALTDLFAEDLLWHVPGRNQLSGDYHGREAVFGLFGKLMEVTEGSFHLDVHAVLADDQHGVAMVITSASRGGQSIEIKDVNVMHLSDGKVVEFWTASTDQYTFDQLIG